MSATTVDEFEHIVSRVVGAPQWWTPELPALLVLMQCLLVEAGIGEKFGINLPRVGYVVGDRSAVVELVDELLPRFGPAIEEMFPGGTPESGESVIATVEGIRPGILPLMPGPVVRPHAEAIIIDVDAATQRLPKLLSFPRSLGGELVNSRARRFEDVVQEMIDSTGWAPSEHLRSIRALKSLRLGGQDVTDFDAVAERDGVLLAVDCKSIVYTPEYDRGDFGVVRNVRTDIEGYVRKWADRIDRLRSDPVGDNYDLSGYRQVIGIICTPHVYFVHVGPLTEPVAVAADGTVLRPACSVGELERFVRSS